MDAPLGLRALRDEITAGRLDTVVVAITDMQGRLQGKRIHAPFFLDTVLEHGTEGCNYLMAVDVEMNTVEGYAISSWSTGYGGAARAARVRWHRAGVHGVRRPVRAGVGRRLPGPDAVQPVQRRLLRPR